MFVGVLKAINGVKIEVEQKKSFLADIHRVNMCLRGLGCRQYKRTTFEGFLCIFLKILAKDMGKPLVPAVPVLFCHLGHPKVTAKPSMPIKQKHPCFKEGWIKLRRRQLLVKKSSIREGRMPWHWQRHQPLQHLSKKWQQEWKENAKYL